jgi:hypothetical protein
VLDAPNASSNIVASTAALWFRFGGPNVMICSGATAGADALRLAGVLLQARRADRVVVVGAEPADEVAAALQAVGSGARQSPLRSGAACLLLQAEPPAEPPADDVEFPQTYGDDVTSSQNRRRAVVELLPEGVPWPREPRSTVGSSGFDPVARWGYCYGAQGVVAVALAAHLAVDEGHGVVGVADPDDPSASGARALVSTLEGWST